MKPTAMMRPLKTLTRTACWGLVSASILAIGCSVKPLSMRGGGELVVVADPLDRPIMRRAIEERFGQIVATPQPEPLFSIIWVDGSTLAERTRAPLILLVASLDGEGPTAELLGRMLTPEVETGVREGEYVVFTRRDPWARQQMLLILVGRSRAELGERITLWADSLYNWALAFEYERLAHQLLHRGENRAAERQLTGRYGFRLRIQPDYILAQANDSLNFVRLIRHHPERWIMVAWGEMSDSTGLTPGFIYARRKQLAAAFLDPVICYDDHWRWERAGFGGLNAVLIRGLWATESAIGGGPFLSYGIWVSSKNMYYIVDGATLAPGEAKMPYLWQLDALAQTFTPPRKLKGSL